MKQDRLIHLYKKYSPSSTLSDSTKERIKQGVLAHLEVRPEGATKQAKINHAWSFSFMRFTTFAVLILAVLSGTAYASGGSLPGDALYSVKRAVEGARLSFASTAESKAKLQVQFTEERIRELDTIETKPSDTPKTSKKTTTPNPTPTTAQLPVATTPTEVTIEPDGQRKPTTHSDAETKARREVLKALDTLEQTQKNFNRQGKRGEAKDLDATIIKLKNKVNVRSWRDSRENIQDTSTPISTEVQPTPVKSQPKVESTKQKGPTPPKDLDKDK